MAQEELAKGSDSRCVVGMDLGGSGIKLGLFAADGSCVRDMTVATPQPATPEAVLAAMVEAIARLDPSNQSEAIGIGTPGPVDATGRIAKIAINLKGWHNVPLADWLEAKTGKPTVLANDANCAGMGEAWLGAGRGCRNFIMLTLGTGVGGAIILDGKLFVGHNGAAGELGLITLNLYGPECNSGNRGSLEQYVSVQAIRRQTGGMEPDHLAHMAKAGNRQAVEFWESYGHHLGTGLASLIYVLSPEVVAIGGGISASADLFLPAAIGEVERRVLPECRSGLQIIPAQLGGKAGTVGAAKLAYSLI